jgi:hypothetical protein
MALSASLGKARELSRRDGQSPCAPGHRVPRLR